MNVNKYVLKTTDIPDDYFIPACGACLARANGGKGCPSPSIAYTYDCKSNSIFTVGECVKAYSSTNQFFIYIIPSIISTWILLWLCCSKMYFCPLAKFFQAHRKRKHKQNMKQNIIK